MTWEAVLTLGRDLANRLNQTASQSRISQYRHADDAHVAQYPPAIVLLMCPHRFRGFLLCSCNILG